MKIKLLIENCSDELEKELKTFIEKSKIKEIVNIKFQRTLDNKYSALIIYQ